MAEGKLPFLPDYVIVGLATGRATKIGRMTRDEAELIKNRAEEIAFRELERVNGGEDVGDEMREALAGWLRLKQRRRGRGRPRKSDTQPVRDVLIAQMVCEEIKKRPNVKLESIYDEVGGRFGLERRSVSDIFRSRAGPTALKSRIKCS